jgi:predicted enzyme related to lactoylglutathione lyase
VDVEGPSPSTTYFENSLDAFDRSDNKHMITSIHTLIYSDDAKATRAFLRDVLGWKYVAEDWDNDWLIFKSGPSEMGGTRRTANGKAKPTITRVTTR